MDFNLTWKRLAGLFVVVLAVYVGGFYTIEYLRRRSGPWEVTFVTDALCRPYVIVNQPRRGLTNVVLFFPEELFPLTNFSQRVVFDRPGREVPFGEVIYEDLMQLPGVVTFNLFGHEVELLPRVLILNKKEVPWRSGTTNLLLVLDKPSKPPARRRPRRSPLAPTPSPNTGTGR